jgi:hypothetical protein
MVAVSKSVMVWRRAGRCRPTEGVDDAQVVDLLVMLQVFCQQQGAAHVLRCRHHQRVPVVQAITAFNRPGRFDGGVIDLPGRPLLVTPHFGTRITGGDQVAKTFAGVGIELIQHLGGHAASALQPAGADPGPGLVALVRVRVVKRVQQHIGVDENRTHARGWLRSYISSSVR